MRIAITGSPATGKTEVARALAGMLKYRLVELNALAEKKGFYCGYDKERRCRIVDVESLVREIKKIEGDIIMESHYAHDMPCDVIIVLRAIPGELHKRMEKKGWDAEKVEENIEAEIMGVCAEEAKATGKKFMEIDTTGKSPRIAAEEIVKALKGMNII